MADHLSQFEDLRERAQDIRLALFDIDGTLIGPDGQWTSQTDRALAFLRDKGIVTAIASGRPPFGTTHLQKALGLQAMGSFYAGALLFEPSTGFRLVQHPLKHELSSLVQSVKADNLYLEVYTEKQYWVDFDSEVARAHSRILGVEPNKVSSIESVVRDESIMKLLIGAQDSPEISALEQLLRIEQRYPEYNFAYAKMVSHPDWLFVSVVDGGVNREIAIEQLARYHGISIQQIMAFGDAQSDFAFIKKAGIGVAMADAPGDVLSVADYVTGSAGEDGVANAINALFLSV